MKHIFISYSRTDAIAMQHVAQTLRENGIKVWTDEKLTPGTADWQTSIQKALDSAGAVVILLSPDAKASEWVGRELSYAQMRKLIIYPLLLRGDPLNALPIQLINAQYLDMRDGNEQLILGKITQAIKGLFDQKEKSWVELVMDELKDISEKIPQIRSVGLISIDGLTMGFYSRSPNADEDRMGAMSAASRSTGERIASELGAGDWKFAVTVGSQATIVEIAVGEEAMLITVIEGEPSIEQTLPLLKASCEKLLTLI